MCWIWYLRRSHTCFSGDFTTLTEIPVDIFAFSLFGAGDGTQDLVRANMCSTTEPGPGPGDVFKMPREELHSLSKQSWACGYCLSSLFSG